MHGSGHVGAPRAPYEGDAGPTSTAQVSSMAEADMRKAKEKALYKKKGSYPEGMYL